MENKCSECGVCCKLFLITLTEEEYKSKRYKTQFEEFGLIEDFNQAEDCGANIIKQADIENQSDSKDQSDSDAQDNSCIYLKNNRCSIHKTRPEACREFFCDSKEERFQDMIEDIRRVKGKFGIQG